MLKNLVPSSLHKWDLQILAEKDLGSLLILYPLGGMAEIED